MTTSPENTTLQQFENTRESVQKFAQKILNNDERVGQFHAQISVMARRDTRIAKCTPESMIAAMLACVHLDLMPNTPEQLAFVIPYFNKREQKFEAQFQIGYKGLVRLAHRSGEIKAMDAELVFEGDEFEVELGSNRRLVHKPDLAVDRTNFAKVTAAYLTVQLTNGAIVFDVMTRKEIDKIRNGAKASSTDAPWNTWPGEMTKKTVVKRGSKLLPTSTTDNRLAMAVHYDSLAESAKLVAKDGEIMEGTVITPDELKEIQAKRIEAAEEERQQMAEDDFQAAAVDITPSDGVDQPMSDEEALTADGDRFDAEMDAVEGNA